MLKLFNNKYLKIIILYSLITITITYPLILKANSHLFKGFVPSSYDIKQFTWEPVWNNVHPDVLGWVYVYAWNAHILTTNPRDYFNANMYYPNKNTLAYNSFSLTNGLIAMPINLIFHNSVLAYNFLIFFSYIMSAFAMYLLTNYFLKNEPIAFISGLMFICTWFNYVRIQDAIIISSEWIPLTLLYLFKFINEKKSKHIFLSLLFYLCQALTEWYSAVFLAYTIGLCILTNIILNGREVINLKNILLFFVVLILVFAILYPLAIPYFENKSQFLDFKRTKDDALWKAFYLDDYLIPKDKIKYIQYAFFIFLLFTPLKLKNLKTDIRQIKTAKYFFVILALFSFIISLGPRLKAFSRVWNIPLPYSLLFDYAPGFEITRDSRRFEILFILSMSFLTSLVIYILTEKIKNINLKRVSLAVFIIIPLINYTSITDFSSMLQYVPSTNKEKIHKIYNWLGSLDKNVAIYQTTYTSNGFEKPGNSFREAVFTYYSTFHWKNTVNGLTWWIPPNYQKLILMKKQFPSKDFLDELKKLKTDYIIIIDCNGDVLDVKNGPLEELIKDGEIKLVKKFTGQKKLIYSYAYQIVYTNNIKS